MKAKDSISDDVELARGFTVRDCRTALDGGDKGTLVKAIHIRFEDRYLEPVTCLDREKKRGFAMMAIACLMIEALESFRRGKPNTKGESRKIFREFFETSTNFKDFRGLGDLFFENVRCGILHQAETTGGWRIKRSGPLFDSHSLTVNATRFLKTLGNELEAFCVGLNTADWNSTQWENVRRKMRSLCDNGSRS